MALSVTVSRVAPVYPQEAEIYDFVAGTAVAPGDAVRLDATSGKLLLASAGTADTSKFKGIALGSAGAGQGVSVLKRGHVYGFDISAVDYAAPIYLDNTGHPAASRFALARALKSRVDALGVSWNDTSGKNHGQYAPFSWRSA